MSDPDWRPSATLEALKARAGLLAEIRAFLADRGVLEVETPLASVHGTTDPAIDSMRSSYQGPVSPEGQPLYLHTSPEFAMKRLLAAGVGPIYQICKVFRNGELGRRHNPEFSLLEWYRPGLDHHGLMDEVELLVRSVLPGLTGSVRLTYREVFLQTLDLDPYRADIPELMRCASRKGFDGAESLALDSIDAWLDLLLTHFVEPGFPPDRLTFIYDYPSTQASLARIRAGEPAVAERFELYAGGMELANGFHELTDAAEQRRRFEKDNEARIQRGGSEVSMDVRFLEALEHGMPECSGVALGVDRLLMLRLGADRIEQVLAFPYEKA